MNRLSASALLVSFLIVGPALAQAPRVVSTDPAPGATNVPLGTTVTFVFDRPVERSQILSVIHGFNLSYSDARIENGNRVVFTVGHQPDQVSTWTVEGFYQDSNCERAPVEAFVLRYTTAPALPSGVVRGTVRFEDSAGKVSLGSGFSTVLRERMTSLNTIADQDQLRQPTVGRAPVSARMVSSATDYEVGMVSAYRIIDPQQAWREYAGSGFVDDSGSFEVPYLGPGEYTLQATYFVESPSTGEYQTYFGAYDPGGDGRPDAISLSEGQSLELEVRLRSRDSFFYTLDERLQEARIAAVNSLPDGPVDPGSLLWIGVDAAGATEDGRGLWSYTFADPASRATIDVGFAGFWDGSELGAYVSGTLAPGTTALPDQRIETTTILANAFGHPDVVSFMSTYEEVVLDVMAAGSSFFSNIGPPSIDGRPTWLVRFLGVSPVDDPSECSVDRFYDASLSLYLDISTGEVLARTLFPALGSTTARAAESVAHDALREVIGDDEPVELLSIEASDIFEPSLALTGESIAWDFLYRTPSLDCVSVYPVSGQIMVDASCPPDASLPIPESFIDSDAIVAYALQEGAGAAFSDFPNASRQLRAGTSDWLMGNDPSYDRRPVWELVVTGYSEWIPGEPAFDFRAITDAATGDVLHVSSRNYLVSSEGSADRPYAIRLDQNYPNPFNPSTTIPFELDRAAHVTLSVFDVTGRLVDTLVDGWQPDGSRVVDWSASALPSGVYFARLTAGNQVQNIRMVLLR